MNQKCLKRWFSVSIPDFLGWFFRFEKVSLYEGWFFWIVMFSAKSQELVLRVSQLSLADSFEGYFDDLCFFHRLPPLLLGVSARIQNMPARIFISSAQNRKTSSRFRWNMQTFCKENVCEFCKENSEILYFFCVECAIPHKKCANPHTFQNVQKGSSRSLSVN